VSLLLVLPPSLPGLVRILREFRRERWDAVHLHGNPSFLVDAVGFLCRLGSRPYVLTFHGAIGDPNRFGRIGGRLYRTLIAIERRIFDHAAAITAVSGTTLGEVRHLGFTAGRMETIPNAGFLQAPKTWPNSAASGNLPERFALSPGSFALCLGAFIPRKGQDLLLKTFAELVAARALPESLQLAFAGFERDREFSAKLREDASRLGIGSRVRFLGEVSNEEKDALLRASRWVIMPSRYEASPVLAFEAMAAGCVLVASDLPNFREIIGEEQNAVTFRAGDAASLARALTDLARDPAREVAIRASALRRSQSFAAWPEVARAYLALFTDSPGRPDESRAGRA
jgi:glycosyltransferase involved in cell wall biosynthesis